MAYRQKKLQRQKFLKLILKDAVSMFQVEDKLDSFYKELVPSVQTLDTPYLSLVAEPPIRSKVVKVRY